jgi:DsbC/DsbD-like thiol-disulfide interchange protein
VLDWVRGQGIEPRPLTISLVAETRSIVPGHSFHLALRQQIEAGWHTYWLNPGDAGLPTSVDWSLPPDFKAGPIQWPLPKRIAYGPVVDYGYENEVLLPVDIDVPSTLGLGTKVVIAAHASWLVCSDTCIPEDARLSISVPVAAETEADPDWTERFASVRARLPLPNPFPTTASVNAENITLHIAMGDAKNLRNVMFFPVDRDVIDNAAPQTPVAGPEGLTLTLRRDGTKSPPVALNGLLTFRDSAELTDTGPEAIMVSSPIGPITERSSGQLAFAWALVLAVAGGILLNLIPCVLPVLSIKAFNLAQHAQSAAREVRVEGLSYAAGVLASFATIAALLLGMRAAGAEIGWGFQLQSAAIRCLDDLCVVRRRSQSFRRVQLWRAHRRRRRRALLKCQLLWLLSNRRVGDARCYALYRAFHGGGARLCDYTTLVPVARRI